MRHPGAGHWFKVLYPVLICLVAAIATAQTTYAQPVEPPADGAYLGAYAMFGEQEDTVTKARLDRYESLSGQKLAWVRFSNWWGRRKFPTRQVRLVQSREALPIFHWAPWPTWDQGKSHSRYKLRRIIAGKWDGFIKRWMRQAKKVGGDVFVEFGVEMNGNWFNDWDGVHNGGGRRSGFGSPKKPDGPERYAAAYRRIVKIARRVGADNITFGFHVNVPGIPDTSWNTFANYYPGDKYIDWVGMSIYGAQQCKWEWTTPKDLIGPAYKELKAMAPSKPIYIGEGGVAECPKLGSKADWIHEFFRVIRTDFPDIKAVNYFHDRWENDDCTISNLRIDSSSAAKKAFRQEAANPYWRHTYP